MRSQLQPNHHERVAPATAASWCAGDAWSTSTLKGLNVGFYQRPEDAEVAF